MHCQIEFCNYWHFRFSVPSRDFVPFKNLLLERFTNAAQRHCFEVEIKGDKDTESYEEFNVSLQPQQDGGLYYPQTIEPDTVTIRILDNDCMFQALKLLFEY